MSYFLPPRGSGKTYFNYEAMLARVEMVERAVKKGWKQLMGCYVKNLYEKRFLYDRVLGIIFENIAKLKLPLGRAPYKHMARKQEIERWGQTYSRDAIDYVKKTNPADAIRGRGLSADKIYWVY